jgi:hypothetical protein
MLRQSGGKPTFPTFEAACVESFQINRLKGREEGLAPAAALSHPYFVRLTDRRASVLLKIDRVVIALKLEASVLIEGVGRLVLFVDEDAEGALAS